MLVDLPHDLQNRHKLATWPRLVQKYESSYCRRDVAGVQELRLYHVLATYIG